jgi:hypothetical protein
MVLLSVFISLRKQFLITYKIIYACIVSLLGSAFGIFFLSLEKKLRICLLIVLVVYTVFIATLGTIFAKRKKTKANSFNGLVRGPIDTSTFY